MAAPAAVFLSYASQDADAARRIAEALRAAGVDVWFDQSELVGGDAWDQKIRRQIKECTLLVPIISANTQSRTEGYFRLEWRLADQRTHLMAKGRPFLLPVVVDDTRDNEAHVPDSFLEVQWTRLPGGETSPAFCARVKQLLQDGEAKVSRPPVITATPGAPQPPSGGMPRWVRPVLASAGLAVAVLAWNLIQRSSPAHPEPTAPASPVSAISPARGLVNRAREIVAHASLTRAQLDAAAELCTQALQLDPNDPVVWAAGAEIELRYIHPYGYDVSEERRRRVLERADRAASLAPDLFEVRVIRAEVYAHVVGTPALVKEAEKTFRDLLATRPGDRELVNQLAEVLREQKRFPEAARLFESVGEFEVAGWSYYEGGQLREAETAVDRSTRSPTGLQLKTILQSSLDQDLDAAQATLDQLQPSELLAETPAVIALRIAYYRRDSARMLELARGLTADYLDSNAFRGPRAFFPGLAHELAGQSALAEGDWRAALAVVAQRLKGTPDSRELLLWSAWLHAALGDQAEAERLFARGQALAGLSGDTLDEANVLVLLRLRKTEAFLAGIERILRARPPQWELIHANVRFNPQTDYVRADPRLDALLRENLPSGAKPLQAAKGASADEKSIAVLPFANLSDDKENEYFSDGISEELLTVLQKVPGLKVSARTSSFSFKGREVTAQEIGAKLGVAHLVEGSVRRAGGQVRITARLSRTATGEQIWSESYTRDLKDIFAVQTELAQTILAQLQSRLGGAAGQAEIAAQVAAATKGGTRNPEAHELYLQGKYFLGRASLPDCIRATGLLQRAVELDPGFALGWAALSSAGWFRGGYGATRQDYEEGYALAKRAADRAIELEPAMPAGWIARFDLQSSTEFDWPGSRESLRRAQAVAPDDPDVMFRISALAYTFGDMPRALELTRRAKALDPVNTQIYIQEGYTLLALGRPAEAQEAFQHVVDLSPNAAWGHAGVGLALVAAGQFAAADEAATRSSIDWSRLYIQTMARFGLKQRAESDRALAELSDRLGEVAAYQVACAHAFRGEADLAFEWLERAYRQRDPGLSWSKRDFFLQPLHPDPRWDAFMHRLGLADDQLTP